MHDPALRVSSDVDSERDTASAAQPASHPPEPSLCRPDGIYLITGGLGGFGLATARWLVEQGARHLVLVGRRGAATPESRQAVRELEQAGARVMIGQADVAGAVQTGVVHLDWSLRGPHTLTAISPRFSRMIPRQDAATAPSNTTAGPRQAPSELLRSAAGSSRRELLRTHLGEQVGKALGMAPTALDPDVPLISLGLESLLAIDLGNRVKKELGLEVTILRLLAGVTINNLLDDLEKQLLAEASGSCLAAPLATLPEPGELRAASAEAMKQFLARAEAR